MTIFFHPPQEDLLSQLSKDCHSFWAMAQTLNDSQKSIMSPKSIMQIVEVRQHGMNGQIYKHRKLDTNLHTQVSLELGYQLAPPDTPLTTPPAAGTTAEHSAVSEQ